MYILLALIAAAALGVGAHFLLPSRDLRGSTVTPAIAVGVAAAVYAVLTWILGEASVWTWVLSIVLPIVTAVLATLALTARRTRSDAALREELGI